MCVSLQPEERRSHVEVCADGGVLVQQISRRIVEDGGAALIADYGHDGTKTDTFRVRGNAFSSNRTFCFCYSKKSVRQFDITQEACKQNQLCNNRLRNIHIGHICCC